MILGGVIALVAWAAALCFYDVKFQRLPDALALPAGCVAFGVALMSDPWALLEGLLWPGIYILNGLIMGSSHIGGGDIKLALTLGILVTLGAGGVSAVLGAIFVAGLTSLAVLLITRDSSVCHGPSMVLGAGVVLVLMGLR